MTRIDKPIRISYGMIIFQLQVDNDTKEKVNMFLRNTPLHSVSCKYIPTCYKQYHDNIKFMLVSRQYTYSYDQFIKGNYNVSNVSLVMRLLQLMSRKELNIIKEAKSFDDIWKNSWYSMNPVNAYAKQQYNKLVNGIHCIKLSTYINSINTLCTPEWGFPKGIPKDKEDNIEAAIREVHEETGITCKDYMILDRTPLIESFTGTDYKKYKNIYYVSMYTGNSDIIKNNINHLTEIENVNWFTYIQAINSIRIYNKERISILTMLYHKLVNILIKIDKDNNLLHIKELLSRDNSDNNYIEDT